MESSSLSCDHNSNFEFAFNSINFSDRVLRIEIVAGSRSGAGVGCKRRRGEEKAAEVNVFILDNIANLNQPDTEADTTSGLYEESVSIVESPSGGESLPGSSDCSPVIREKSIFINSAILAAESPFFYKLYSNGTQESDKRATLRINASEEAALMELLSFIYSGKLSSTSPSLVLDVLMAANKFEVASCLSRCSQLLRSIPLTIESALLYLEIASSVSMLSAVQPLIDAAKEFIANKYRDISKFQDEVINLPLAGIEAILISDTLQAASEDEVYDTVIKWAKAQYPVLKDRRDILRARVGRLIRFPFMTCQKLREILASPDLDCEFAKEAVLQAFLFNSETPSRQRALVSEDRSRCLVRRAYKLRPVKAIELELPYPQCIVYFDLKKDECAGIFPGRWVQSQRFGLGGHWFYLVAHYSSDQKTSSYNFWLSLQMEQEKGSVAPTVDYEFAVRTRLTGDFASNKKGCCTFTKGNAAGYGFARTGIMADDIPHSIDGVLHLRVELIIKPQSQLQPLLSPQEAFELR